MTDNAASRDLQNIRDILHPEPSPYALQPYHLAKGKKRSRPPAMLRPLPSNRTYDPALVQNLVISENIVLDAILRREDALEQTKSLLHNARQLPVHDIHKLRLQCCMATVNVLLAIRDWRQQLAAIQSFGRIFHWNGVSYIHKLTTDVPTIKQTLVATESPTAMPNPFFLPCTLESLLVPNADRIDFLDADTAQRLHAAAKFLFHDTEFTQLWKESTALTSTLHRSPIRQHAKSTHPVHPFVDKIHASQVEALQLSVLWDTSPGFGRLCQAFLHHVCLDIRWNPQHFLNSLKSLQVADVSSSAEMALVGLFSSHPSCHPLNLFRDHVTAAYLSLFLLHLTLQCVNRKRCPQVYASDAHCTSLPFEAFPTRTMRAVIRGALVQCRPSSSGRVVITVASPSYVSVHSMTADDFLDMTQPSSNTPTATLCTLTPPSPSCWAWISAVLNQHSLCQHPAPRAASGAVLVGVVRADAEGLHGVRLGSMDAFPTTTLAQARAYIDANYFLERPTPFQFLYRGSHCPVGQEKFRSVVDGIHMANDPTLVLCSIKPPSTHSMPGRRKHTKAVRMVAHLLHIPIARALEEQRVREEQARLDALARLPRPKTSLCMMVQVDVPSLDLSPLRIPNDRSWTVAQLFSEISTQLSCCVTAATHSVYVSDTLLPLDTVLSEATVDRCTLSVVHRRFDIDVPCGVALYVEQHSDRIVVQPPVRLETPLFDHWALAPGRIIMVGARPDAYTITKRLALASWQLNRRYDGPTDWRSQSTLHLPRQLSDPRLPWEVQDRLALYVARHRTKVSGLWCGKIMSVPDALSRLQTSEYLVLLHLRALSVDWFVDFLYDTICTAFPHSYGITPVKFTAFIKSFHLGVQLNVVTATESHMLFNRYIDGIKQVVLLKPQFRRALEDIAHVFRPHMDLTFPCAANTTASTEHSTNMDDDKLLLTTNFVLHRFFFAHVLSHAPLPVQDAIFGYATDVALTELIQDHCALLFVQSRVRMQWWRQR
ncbi:hypothetical protein H310_02150 [Aphanomyces invadans]|uniref:Uncharacterized protein n=1 Tax=Aphanomyces invadans TaxID=157072 RepID=A0A024UPX5_9STRA|nr:hypothetical protein H310_02150 [Aphanomyces invadans]ETW07693.1 hypothetical protein H310_02150 [Aphanomyces invadans]|eukprot:XP_008863786.1 hypothetical protein H310_02150 [Aphanomyces invadans]